MKRAIAFLIAVVLAAALVTCDRVVELVPDRDASLSDSDGGLPDPPSDALTDSSGDAL